MARPKGLGKGLSALIPQTVLTAGRTIVNVDVDKILPNPRQPRESFAPKGIAELADSIKAQGIAQPILARQRGEKYEIVAGERRWRAVKKAGLKVIPAIIKDFNDEESLEIALVENLQREDLNPMDEAEAYKRLNNEFELTQAEIAKKVGKDRTTITNMMRLLELPLPVQKSLRKEEIAVGHARPLLSIREESKCLVMWKEIVKKNLNVREVEELTYGSRKTQSKTKKGKLVISPELLDVTELLIQYLGTKVRVRGNLKKGKIEIEYFSQEDLERLIELITSRAI